MVTKAIVSNNVPAPIIPLQSNIRNYVDKYLEDHADIPELIKEQKSVTIKTIQQILVERGIPAGLTYLAIVAWELNSQPSKSLESLFSKAFDQNKQIEIFRISPKTLKILQFI